MQTKTVTASSRHKNVRLSRRLQQGNDAPMLFPQHSHQYTASTLLSNKYTMRRSTRLTHRGLLSQLTVARFATAGLPAGWLAMLLWLLAGRLNFCRRRRRCSACWRCQGGDVAMAPGGGVDGDWRRKSQTKEEEQSLEKVNGTGVAGPGGNIPPSRPCSPGPRQV